MTLDEIQHPPNTQFGNICARMFLEGVTGQHKPIIARPHLSEGEIDFSSVIIIASISA
jgi:hypothetical protein